VVRSMPCVPGSTDSDPNRQPCDVVFCHCLRGGRYRLGEVRTDLAAVVLTFFLKETQGWDTVKISVSLAVVDLPWIIKPLWGAISDFVPLFGYRRRSYLVIANVIVVGAFAWVATLTTIDALIPALVLTSISMAISSTLCGALLVENGQKHNASGRFVNQQWLWFNITLMLAGMLGGFLIEILSPVGALRAAA
jgi:BT1 family